MFNDLKLKKISLLSFLIVAGIASAKADTTPIVQNQVKDWQQQSKRLSNGNLSLKAFPQSTSNKVSTRLIAKGGETGGGGHVVVCSGMSVVTLDYFNALLKAGSNKLINPETEDVISIISSRLNEGGGNIVLDNKRLGDWLFDIITSRGSVASWVDADLKMIEDYNLIYNLPTKCKLLQAAAQEQHGQTVEMYQNSKVVNNVSEGQRKILQIHEALYTLVRLQLGVDSKPVRALLEKLLLKDLSNEVRDRAIEIFFTDLESRSNKFVCMADGYQRLFEGSKKFRLISKERLVTYGRTIEEAFLKLMSYEDTGIIPCNAIDGDPNTGLYVGRSCLKQPNLAENCSQNIK